MITWISDYAKVNCSNTLFVRQHAGLSSLTVGSNQLPHIGLSHVSYRPGSTGCSQVNNFPFICSVFVSDNL